MRKHYVAVFMAIVMCLAVLSGCSLLKSLEHDVNVVFEVDGKYVDGVTVNIFNNAIAPEFDVNANGAVPDGFKFMGWSAKHDWKYGDDKDLLISSGGIVRYDAVKDWVNEGGTAVAVPIIIDEATIPRADLVIAWYSKFDTSGISESNMKTLETDMRSFLTERGYDVAGMDIVIRAYDGNVSSSCAAIIKDDDVDIMVGWANNITSSGNIAAKENVSGVGIGSKSDRYAARLNNNYLSRLIFTWMLNTYGGKNLEYPTPDDASTPEPSEEYGLVIAWYNNSSDASGISEDNMKDFKTNLETYLQSQGYTSENLKVGIRSYIGSVSNTCASVKKDNDVDIMLGWNSAITNNGMTEGTDFIEQVEGITVGTKSRNVALVKDTEISRLVYAWIQSEYGPEPVVTYTVTFNSNGGSAVDGQEVESGKTVQPATPTRDGYTFEGWYIDDVTFENEYDFATPVTGNLDLYAKWTDGNPEPEPAYDFGEFTQTKLVLGWWNNGSSGLNEDLVKDVIEGLKAALTASGIDVTTLTIEYKDYSGKVGPAGEAILADTDAADILLGFGGNLTTSTAGGATGGNLTMITKRISGVKMGTATGRYIDLYDETNDFALAVFNWFKDNADARALFVPEA